MSTVEYVRCPKHGTSIVTGLSPNFDCGCPRGGRHGEQEETVKRESAALEAQQEATTEDEERAETAEGSARQEASMSHDERQSVSPFGQLLMHTPLDELFSFLQTLDVDFTLTRSKKGKRRSGFVWSCEIRREGMAYYVGGSPKSPKAAVVNVLEKFLLSERADYHELLADNE